MPVVWFFHTATAYIETIKHIIKPSESLLGQPKTVEEIADYIDADIVKD